MNTMTKQNVISLYRKRARRYNFTANLYYLVGYREFAYRKKAVDALNLQPGDTVVEIGCGTGLNFPLLQEAVGPEGQIIGVDLTDAMLAQAQKQVESQGWTNVELVHSDATQYRFPERVDGVISTFAITIIPGYDQVIKNGAEALAPGKRFVILDLKRSGNMPRWMINLGILILKPFGGSTDVIGRLPLRSMEKYLADVLVEEFFFGLSYVASGEKLKE